MCDVTPPPDADARRAVKPVICYPTDTLPKPDLALYQAAREGAEKIAEVLIPPREAEAIEVPKGHFLRLVCPEGKQVGDFNLFNSADLTERFYSGKTPGAAWIACDDRRPALVLFPGHASHGDDRCRYAWLVWDGCVWRFGA